MLVGRCRPGARVDARPFGFAPEDTPRVAQVDSRQEAGPETDGSPSPLTRSRCTNFRKPTRGPEHIVCWKVTTVHKLSERNQ
jgi:hypothetical protein